MANREPEVNNVHVETNLNTRLSILAHCNEPASDFAVEFRKQHQQFFPQFGEINIITFKVQRRGDYYVVGDMSMRNVFQGFDVDEWFMYADVETVDKRELVAIMPAVRNDGLVLVDGNTIEGGLETKKRKIESSGGKKSRKKSKIAVATGGNVQVEVAMTELAIGKDIEKGEKDSMGEEKQASDADMLLQEKSITSNSERVGDDTRDELNDVQATQTLEEALETDERQEARGEVLSEKVDDLTEAMEQDLGDVGKSAGLDKVDQEKELAPISSRDDVTESHEASAAVQVDVAPEHCDTLPREKLDDLASEVIEKDIGRGEGSSLASVPADNIQTTELATYQENQLEDSSGGPATEKRKKKKKSSKDDINESTATASKSSRKIAKEISRVPGNEIVEKIVEDVGRENTETNNLESNPASHLEVTGGLTTRLVSEKKRKRTETSKDDINQSVADATTTSRENVNEINDATGNLDRVDATSESLAISERGNLGNALPNAMQKENEMGEKIDDDAENQLASSGLVSGTATEKKKKQKKSSKDHINQSTAAGTTVSREVVNETEKVSVHVDTTDDKRTLEHEVVKDNCEIDADAAKSAKSTKKKKSRKTKTPNDADEIQAEDNVQVPDLATTHENEVVKDNDEVDADESKSVMKSTKKKKSRKNKTPTGADEIQAQDNVQVTDLATTNENEVARDNGEVDADESKSVMKSTKKKRSRKTTTPTGADEIQAEDNVQVTDLATTHENEVAKDNGQVDVDEAKSVMKSTKKKKSRKTTTPAEENTMVCSGLQNVEPFKVVDGEGPDSVIRNVLDSLQQRNETQERLDKIEKKASKKSKKNLSSNMVDSKVLSVEVNNAVQEAVPPMNNPEDTDASWTSVKKNTKSDASRLKDRIEAADNNEDPYLSQQTQKDRTEVADNDEDPYLSQQTQKEKADLGDNFGSRQKDDIVVGGKKQDKMAGGAKSKKEKKSLDMRPAGSIDGSLNSMKSKERNSRGKLASSGTSLLKTRLKNDRIGSKVDDSITSVKKSSNSLTMNKNTLGFFKDANSSEDESKRTPPPHVSTKPSPDNSSTKSPSDSSDDDSDVTSMSRQQGNNLAGGALKFSGSLQDILRSSKSYKKAKVTASQYMSDDDSPALVFVPESQV